MSDDINITIEDASPINITVEDAQPINITIEGGVTLPSQYDYIQFNTSVAATPVEGRLAWNADDGTLDLGLIGGDVNLQIGQENVVRVFNSTGSTITNGSVVYISGANGNNPLISLADADSVATSSVIGLATEDIDTGSHGYVTTFGRVRQVNTQAFAPGTTLYLSQTAGQFTSTPPSAPAQTIRIGTVVRQNTNNGIILVNVDPIPSLGQLPDVTFPFALQNGQFLRYNTATLKWINSIYVPDLTSTVQNSFDIPTGTGHGLYGFDGYVVIGDYNGIGNGTIIQVDDDNGIIHLHAVVGILTDDLTCGGLTASSIYNTGAMTWAVKTITGAGTLAVNDRVVVSTGSSPFNFQLYNATAVPAGQMRVYTIINRGSATMTLTTTAGQTIDGAASLALTAGQKVTVGNFSGNWITV